MEAVPASSRAAASAPSSARKRYARPSVHEVAVAIVFETQASASDVESAQQFIKDPALRPQRVEQSRVELVSGFGPIEAHASADFLGWAFQSEGWPRWMVRVWNDRLTVNMLRSDRWPTGEYVGWDALYDRFVGFHRNLVPVYGALRPRRLGVRYLNRFSVPVADSLERWLTLFVCTPRAVTRPRGLRVRLTWDVIEGYPGFSTTINLATLPADQADRIGVLLDIDVFTTDTHGMDYMATPGHLATAHAAENAVFESCITDALRAQFDAA